MTIPLSALVEGWPGATSQRAGRRFRRASCASAALSRCLWTYLIMCSDGRMLGARIVTYSHDRKFTTVYHSTSTLSHALYSHASPSRFWPPIERQALVKSPRARDSGCPRRRRVANKAMKLGFGLKSEKKRAPNTNGKPRIQVRIL